GEPEALAADLRVEREGGKNVDAFDVAFYYPRGFRAVVSSSTLAPAPRPHFRVRGTQATYLKQNLDPQEALLRAGRPMGGESWGLESPGEWGTLVPSNGGTPRPIPSARGDYRLFYENVRDALLGKAALLVTPDAALRVMYALELAEEASAARGILPWRLAERVGGTFPAVPKANRLS